MRQSNNGRRTRGGRPTRRPGPLKSQTFDSNGPEVRIRGNAHQVLEKYQNLARDAYTNGDRVMAESYYQFAEHYYRIIHETTDPESAGSQRRQNNGDRDEGQRDEGHRDDSDERDQQGEQSNSRRRSDYSNQRQPDEERDSDEMAAEGESRQVNGGSQVGDDREGLERTLGAKTLALPEEGTEQEAAQQDEESGGEAAKSSRSNGQRTTRSRTRYRRSSSRSDSEDEAATPKRRQFPMPAEGSETAEGGETTES